MRARPHARNRVHAVPVHLEAAVITVPEFADGAVAELSHGPDGEVIAEIRIPGPVNLADLNAARRWWLNHMPHIGRVPSDDEVLAQWRTRSQ